MKLRRIVIIFIIVKFRIILMQIIFLILYASNTLSSLSLISSFLLLQLFAVHCKIRNDFILTLLYIYFKGI